MNILTKNFEEFVENISLDDSQIHEVEKRSDEVCEALHRQYCEGEYDSSSKVVIGSFAKNTQVKPEIDVIFKIPESLKCNEFINDSDVNVFYGIEKSGNYEVCFDGKWIEMCPDCEKANIVDNCENNNLVNLIKITKHWKYLKNVDISSFYIELKACEFIRKTYHDTDSFLLYGFMIMKFYEFLLNAEDVEIPGTGRVLKAGDAWIEDCKSTFELLHDGVTSDDKEESIRCFREVFGDKFPESIYELNLGEYVKDANSQE